MTLERPLGELADLRIGATSTRLRKQVRSEEVSTFSFSTDPQSLRARLLHRELVNPGVLKTYSLKAGDILVSTLFNSDKKDTHLRSAVLEEEDLGGAGVTGLFMGHTLRIRPWEHSGIDPHFLGWWLRSRAVWTQLASKLLHLERKGQRYPSQATLNAEDFRQLSITLPPITEQREWLRAHWVKLEEVAKLKREQSDLLERIAGQTLGKQSRATV